MKSLRFNPPLEWNLNHKNRYFFGFFDFLNEIDAYYQSTTLKQTLTPTLNLLEIGSYMGESTSLFAATGLFKEIHCVDPFKGEEKANKYLNENWEDVFNEFKINTRHWDNIILHKDYSYNIVNNFPDNYFDVVYIDANHEYKAVKQDLNLCFPKIKPNGIISGHDYSKTWPGVVKAVNEFLEKNTDSLYPNMVYSDETWIKELNKNF